MDILHSLCDFINKLSPVLPKVHSNLRINLYGGPGIGKSTLAALVYGRLKTLGCSTELIGEYIKSWAYEKRHPESFDQVYIFAKQQRLEERVLRAGVQLTVNDSPLFLSCYYARKYNAIGWEDLISIARKFNERYPALNLCINRHKGDYQSEGRYQTYDEAVKIDQEVQEFLQEYKIPYTVIDNNPEEIVKLALHAWTGIMKLRK